MFEWRIVALLLGSAAAGWGQFGSSIEGLVEDPSGSVVPNATITMHQVSTGVAQEAQTNGHGFYRFSALSAGDYELTAASSGFASQTSRFTLTTNQSRDVNFTMQVQSATTQVQVASTAPLLDTAETREQLTIDSKTLRDLPLQGNSIFNVMALAPGVTGTNPTTNNFQPEQFSGMSANGRSPYGNSFNVDGVNTGSNITNGTSNLLINPDQIQEISIQTNVFNAEQGRGSSIVTSITTKSGTNQFHGAGNYYFTNQNFLARTSLPFVANYTPSVKQEVDGVLGGPIIKNRTFFFASVDALFSKAASSSSQTFEDPQFVAFANQRFPGTVGTTLLNQFPIKGVATTGVQSTASQLFGNDCGPASTTGIPCSLPVLDQGTFSPSPVQNGLQYGFRGDQYLGSKDRFYASYVRNSSTSGSPATRPAFTTTNDNDTYTGQANWTRTVSATFINEFTFGATYVQGTNGSGGNYEIPSISVQNTTGTGQGFGGTFYQHNYEFRDMLTLVRGRHTLKLGGSYYWGDDVALFAEANSRPNFYYENILDFVQDKVYSGNYGTYNPLTGKPNAYNFGAKLNTESLFAQDNWKMKPNLTVDISMRWDDFGNPSAIGPLEGSTWKMTNIFVAPGNTVDQQFPTAAVQVTNHPFRHRLNRNFSPRLGVAWSPGNKQKTSIHGGIGLYNDWVTLGETVDRVNGNPPNFVYPSFGVTVPLKPILSLGTSNTYPFGFVQPPIPAASLNAQGGIPGLNSGVGGLDPNLTASKTVNWVFGIDQQIASHTVIGGSYVGSHTWDQLVGTDYNRIAGDLFDGVLNRINSSFGQMWYITNFDKIDYNAAVATVKSQVGNSLNVQGSYTWSHNIDYFDGGERSTGYEQIPDPRNLALRRGDTNFDVRQRFSASGVYTFPTPFHRNFIARTVLGGWEVGATAAIQTGTPYGWYTNAPFDPVLNSQGNVIGLKPDSGDYNADGFGEDYPNQAPGLPRIFSRSHFLGADAGQAAYTSASFSQPVPGTEGNGSRGYFRNQGLLDLDASLLKNNKLGFLGEAGNLQLKFEFFNVLNRVNLGGINNNVTDPNFGKILNQIGPFGQGGPRLIQVGARISF